MLARTYSQASRTDFEASAAKAALPPQRTHAWIGLALAASLAAAAWFGSAHALVGWQIY